MVICDTLTCPNCGGDLKYYDTVRRIIRTKRRSSEYVLIRRLKCMSCNKLHREIPDYIYPHKQYEAEVIQGVIEGFITPETIGFEDYPCEMTMKRWKSQRRNKNIPGQLSFCFDMEFGSEIVLITDFVCT